MRHTAAAGYFCFSLSFFAQRRRRNGFMDVSFSGFFQEVLSNPILTITVLLTLGVIFVNGWTDAPNAIATCIATRCMKVRSAI